MWAPSGTLHICELCISVLEFVYIYKTFVDFQTLKTAGVAARRPLQEAVAASYYEQRGFRICRNKESVFCRKLSKIYPPCQNPDRFSYRLLNRLLARRARVVDQMKRADGSKTLSIYTASELLWHVYYTLYSCLKEKRWIIFLPITDDRVRRRLVPVATTLLLTAAAETSENESQMLWI